MVSQRAEVGEKKFVDPTIVAKEYQKVNDAAGKRERVKFDHDKIKNNWREARHRYNDM